MTSSTTATTTKSILMAEQTIANKPTTKARKENWDRLKLWSKWHASYPTCQHRTVPRVESLNLVPHPRHEPDCMKGMKRKAATRKEAPNNETKGWKELAKPHTSWRSFYDRWTRRKHKGLYSTLSIKELTLLNPSTKYQERELARNYSERESKRKKIK